MSNNVLFIERASTSSLPTACGLLQTSYYDPRTKQQSVTRRNLQTPGTAEEHKRQETPTAKCNQVPITPQIQCHPRSMSYAQDMGVEAILLSTSHSGSTIMGFGLPSRQLHTRGGSAMRHAWIRNHVTGMQLCHKAVPPHLCHALA